MQEMACLSLTFWCVLMVEIPKKVRIYFLDMSFPCWVDGTNLLQPPGCRCWTKATRRSGDATVFSAEAQLR